MSRQSSRTPSRVGSGVLSRQASIEVHRQLSDALVRSASSGFAMVGGWSAAEDDDDGEGSGRVHDHHASKRLKPCDFEVVGGGAQGSGGDAVQVRTLYCDNNVHAIVMPTMNKTTLCIYIHIPRIIMLHEDNAYTYHLKPSSSHSICRVLVQSGSPLVGPCGPGCVPSCRIEMC